jgi:hypothetical protein
VWRGWVLGNEALFDDMSSRQHALMEDPADDNTIGLRRLGNVHLFRRYLPDVAAYFFKDITVCDPALFSGLDSHAESFQLGLIFLARGHGNPPMTSKVHSLATVGNACGTDWQLSTTRSLLP